MRFRRQKISETQARYRAEHKRQSRSAAGKAYMRFLKQMGERHDRVSKALDPYGGNHRRTDDPEDVGPSASRLRAMRFGALVALMRDFRLTEDEAPEWGWFVERADEAAAEVRRDAPPSITDLVTKALEQEGGKE